VFVTSQGSAYSQFKRALERRNFLLAWTMAAELPKVPLADALSLLLLALDQQPWRFEPAAPHWHARLCDEAQLTLPEAQLALSALHALAGPSAVCGVHALVAVCSANGLDDAVGVLHAWLDARA
jgi:HPt (histidine-containing phosphotransfer) domain-containing protein